MNLSCAIAGRAIKADTIVKNNILRIGFKYPYFKAISFRNPIQNQNRFISIFLRYFLSSPIAGVSVFFEVPLKITSESDGFGSSFGGLGLLTYTVLGFELSLKISDLLMVLTEAISSSALLRKDKWSFPSCDANAND
jgi:hypothetical protein